MGMTIIWSGDMEIRAPLYTFSRDYDVGVMPSAIYAKTLIPDKTYKVVIEGSRVSLLATGERLP